MYVWHQTDVAISASVFANSGHVNSPSTAFAVISWTSGRGAKCCDQRNCLSVCVGLSVRSHISKTTCPNFTKFSVHVICGRGSVLLWRRCNMLRTSGFVDEFSHNGTNTDKGLEPTKQRVIHRDSPGGATKLCTWGGKACYRRSSCSVIEFFVIKSSTNLMNRLMRHVIFRSGRTHSGDRKKCCIMTDNRWDLYVKS